VILSGVHDIKNLKAKILPGSEHNYNSPWNIAASFDVDLGFSADGIATMLREYEGDHLAGIACGFLSLSFRMLDFNSL
jgi:hypothetical protein